MTAGPILVDYAEALLRVALDETPAGSRGPWGPRRRFRPWPVGYDNETVLAILHARGY